MNICVYMHIYIYIQKEIMKKRKIIKDVKDDSGILLVCFMLIDGKIRFDIGFPLLEIIFLEALLDFRTTTSKYISLCKWNGGRLFR